MRRKERKREKEEDKEGNLTYCKQSMNPLAALEHVIEFHSHPFSCAYLFMSRKTKEMEMVEEGGEDRRRQGRWEG